MTRRALALCALLFLPSAALAQTLLPPGFTREVVVAGLDEPTSVVVADDGRVFVGLRNGEIRLVEAGLLNATPVVSLPTTVDAVDRGLVGIELDPAFATNGWLYVHRITDVLTNRVSRVTVVGNVADPATEVVLYEDPITFSAIHHGGGLTFGHDGKLYVGTGDYGQLTPAQDLTNPRGKVLRLNPDGSTPADNPFVGVPGADERIWVYGLRNCLRLHTDSLTGDIWLGDVGGDDAWSHERVIRATPGANYGWPDQDGDMCLIADCSVFDQATWAWRHDDPAYQPYFIQGTAIAGPVYRGSMFPASYHGSVFFADYTSGQMRTLQLDAGGNPVADPVFIMTQDAGTIADMAVAPDGSLYTVTVGLPWSGFPDAPLLHRISYDAGNVCGFTNYASEVVSGNANVLDVTGSGSTSLGGTFTLTMGGIDPLQVISWMGVYLAPAQYAGLGGIINVQVPTNLFVDVVPTAGGVAPWSATLPNNPAFLGFPFFFQGAALDASQTFGFALTDGIRLVVCP